MSVTPNAGSRITGRVSAVSTDDCPRVCRRAVRAPDGIRLTPRSRRVEGLRTGARSPITYNGRARRVLQDAGVLTIVVIRAEGRSLQPRKIGAERAIWRLPSYVP